ncbi:dual specificity phosphatase [Aspergillus transmontanensis]|uniref:protein-tyrosine-phosphatase n=1 Tax=Aspergillus transmontanensis TaxID=1034304 RepID=A0A5N6W8Z5_9EURO|nr:dual specificity phosphatase [Aspergillus transmontanensis]
MTPTINSPTIIPNPPNDEENQNPIPETKSTKNSAERKTRDERRKAWQKAFGARMREIIPGLVLGNVESSHKYDMLRENGINAIVSLTNARWAWWRGPTRRAGIPEHRHKWVQCVDSSTQDLLVYMSDICDFIEQMAPPALRASSTLPGEQEHVLGGESLNARPGAVLVHCDMGISRSPTVIIAYLMRKYGIDREDALTFVQSKQKVKPSANFTRQLQIWEQVGYQVWENDERTIPKAPYQAFLDDRAALLKEKGLTGNEPLAPLTLV